MPVNTQGQLHSARLQLLRQSNCLLDELVSCQVSTDAIVISRCQRKLLSQVSQVGRESFSASLEGSNSNSCLSVVSERLPYSIQMDSLSRRQQICQDVLNKLEETWPSVDAK